MMFMRLEEIIKVLENDFTDVEMYSEKACAITVGSLDMECEKWDNIPEIIENMVKTLENLGFDIEEHDEIENSYMLTNGVLRIYIYDGIYED